MTLPVTAADHARVLLDALGTDPADWTRELHARGRMSFLALGRLDGGRELLEDALVGALRDRSRPRWSKMAIATILRELLDADDAREIGETAVRRLRASLRPRRASGSARPIRTA